MISCIINTAALSTGGGKSFQGVPVSQRAYALRNFILPQYKRHFVDIIVVGEWEEGPDYRYIPCPSEYHDWRDALKQRQLGFEASRGDIIWHQHDDHFLELPNIWIEVEDELSFEAGVVIPYRYTRLRSSFPEPLNNGETGGYISGHAAFYHRRVLEACPWKGVPLTRTWDVSHTAQIRLHGFSIAREDRFTVFDVEYGGEPWR